MKSPIGMHHFQDEIAAVWQLLWDEKEKPNLSRGQGHFNATYMPTRKLC